MRGDLPAVLPDIDPEPMQEHVVGAARRQRPGAQGTGAATQAHHAVAVEPARTLPRRRLQGPVPTAVRRIGLLAMQRLEAALPDRPEGFALVRFQRRVFVLVDPGAVIVPVQRGQRAGPLRVGDVRRDQKIIAVFVADARVLDHVAGIFGGRQRLQLGQDRRDRVRAGAVVLQNERGFGHQSVGLVGELTIDPLSVKSPAEPLFTNRLPGSNSR